MGIARPIEYHALVGQADTPRRRKYRASEALHSKIGLLSPLLQLINSVLHRPYSKGKCLSKEAVGNASTDDGDAVIRRIGRRAGGDGGVDGHNTPPDPR